MPEALQFSSLWRLLRSFSWQELRHHPWRNAVAVLAVTLGVALAFSVHLINASALDEFSGAARSVGGQPDLELRSSAPGGIDEALFAQVLHHPSVAIASPVLQLGTFAQPPLPDGAEAAQVPPARVMLKLVGVDALQVAGISPDLLPQPSGSANRIDIFAPDAIFLNATARTLLPGATVRLQQGLQLKTLRVAGHVSASGAALGVMDIGAMQDFFGKLGQISRVDIRLKTGTDKNAFVQSLTSTGNWPAAARLAEPEDAAERIDNLSRAYRVNLTVLALIALFTGGFLVFSVLSLSVARRAQQFALLGVLGLTGRERLSLVLMEAALLGLVGSTLGLALGTALAVVGLRVAGGDLGGGFFSGVAPALHWSVAAATVFGSLGLACALAGAWWPARAAQRLPAAQTLKGLGFVGGHGRGAVAGAAMLGISVLLALLPPVHGIALAAYVSVALMLLGGITAMPALVGWLLDGVAPLVKRNALALLAVERARRLRDSAAVAVSGVVAALSLAVALTIMVSSFRTSVNQWLDAVLPASMYVRTSNNNSANDIAFLDPAFVTAAARTPGVARLATQRTVNLALDATKPSLVLIAKPLRDPETHALMLPLVGEALAVPPGRIGIYVSEAVPDLYGVKPGGDFPALRAALAVRQTGTNANASAPTPAFFVAGVWRDYARQFGSVAMEQGDFVQLSQDSRVNDLALWLEPGASVSGVQQSLRGLVGQLSKDSGTPGAAADLLEFASTQNIREISLKIFDRSFAVTYWLQAVAIGIGLFGVAASFGAQVLARRKEFGMLQHLGLTRRQVLRLVTLEGAAWTGLGAVAGVGLGLAVAAVLVYVVNPQSFHWTMDLHIPWWRLLALAAAVVVAGTVTIRLSGRSAAGRDAVLAVKEDW